MPIFDPLGFSPAYDCEVDPEFPGNGDWGVPVHGYWRDGRREAPSRSAWGGPTLVRVTRADRSAWVAWGEAGGLGGISGAFGCPNGDALCLVVMGQAYLVDTRRPENYQPLLLPVGSVKHFEGLDLLLLATNLELAAVGHQGLLWRTGRLCLDELRLVGASSQGIECVGGFLDRDERLVLSPHDGRLLSGPTCPY
ncbi:MAG: hypothetical protein L0Y66_18520 [Myxococcaceae bacterium]|nr:hypothetical protein [Myxococcaceae bacterium]